MEINAEVLLERINNLHGDVIEIKNDVKAQNGRVRKLEQTKVDKDELRTIKESVKENSKATAKIISAASTAVALLSLLLLAYKTFSQ